MVVMLDLETLVALARRREWMHLVVLVEVVMVVTVLLVVLVVDWQG